MLRPRISSSVLVVSALLLVAVAPSSLAAGGYDIAIDGAIDTVDRDVSTSYGEFTVTQVGRADVGERVTISVDAPSDADYSLSVLDAEQRIRRSRTASGGTTVTFHTDGLDPATYAVAVGNQSADEVYAVEPLVVRAYAVVVESNTTVEAGSALDVAVELDQVASGEPVREVQIAATNGSNHVRVDATDAGESTYRATVPTDELAPGGYSLYAVVRSDGTALGERELVGVSDEVAIDVVEQSTESSDESDSGGDGSSDGGSPDSGSPDGGPPDSGSPDGGPPDGGPPDSGSSTTESSETTTPAPTDTETPSETSEMVTTAETTTESTTFEETTTAKTDTSATSTDTVLAPNEKTPNDQTTQEQTTSSELPNTAPQVIFGLLVTYAVGRRLAQD
ncbi:cell surface protein [Haloferax namakaokahaiae]|uniref:Cell surface protein n=1 Tax=Haloferax namakaokahaiae TaxID=1748331 RepID=A0ABD5ZBZ6_9EURY